MLEKSFGLFFFLKKPLPSAETAETAIIDAFAAHRRRYGVRCLIAELRGQGFTAGHYKIRKVLRKYGLKTIQPRSFVPRTTDSRHPYPISSNRFRKSISCPL